MSRFLAYAELKMKKTVLLSVALLASFPAHAQPKLIQAHSGSPPPTCTGGYVGPGDLSASPAITWGGLRAYSCAVAGLQANAAILCTPADVACETESLAQNGNLALGTIGATCNTSVNICTVKQLYKQSSGAGGDFVQNTILDRPTFDPSCAENGGHPCWRWPNARTTQGLTATIPATAPPYTFSVAGSVGSFNFGRFIGAAAQANPITIYTNSGNSEINADCNGSDVSNGTALSTGTFYGIIGDFTGVHTVSVVNSGFGAVGACGSTTSTSLVIGNDVGASVVPPTGAGMETGMWPGLSGTEQANIIANQRAYGGF